MMIGRIVAVATIVALASTAACASAPPAAAPGAQSGRPYVVMISSDGFRHDYPDRYTLPTLAQMEREGVRARALIPTFPTKTFPNHYSLISGMYAGHHGLVGNEMFDPATRKRYSIGDRAATADASWYGGEPIWVTAERQGVKAATYFWPTSDAAIQGVRPSYWKPYEHMFPDSARVDSMLAWLALPPAQRPHLVLGYFSAVDDSAHRSGPDAPATRRAVEHVDRMIGRLRAGIARLPIADSVTVILVSDHGLTQLDSVMFLEDYLPLDDTVAVVAPSTYAQLFYDGDRAKIDRAVAALRRMPHAHVWRNAELPERFHLRGHRRAGDVFVLIDPPFVVNVSRRGRTPPYRPSPGNHGFDNQVPDMHGIFIAAGAGVRPGATLGELENVHVYPFIAHLLGLRPAAGIDGRLEATRGILRR